MIVIIKVVGNEFQASKRNISTQIGHDFWSVYEHEIIISREMHNEMCSCYESKRVRLFATFLETFPKFKNVIISYLSPPLPIQSSLDL